MILLLPQVYKSYNVDVIRHFVDSVDIMTNSLWSHTKGLTGKHTPLSDTVLTPWKKTLKNQGVFSTIDN